MPQPLAHDRHGLALGDDQVDAVDGTHRLAITPEVAPQTLGPHDRAHLLPVHRVSHASSQRMSACNRSAEPSNSSTPSPSSPAIWDSASR